MLYSTYGPTPNHLETLAACERDLAEVQATLERATRERLPQLEARLDEAGVPWTPGRTGR